MRREPRYADLDDGEVVERIRRAKEALGSSVTILGHHYQHDEVIRFADHRGDSLELSRRAAEAREARYIVFCGVRFMAETAAILCAPDQVVIQPVEEALCPMARMASARTAMEAWEVLSRLYGPGLVPITYQNSTAEVKAFVGQRGGAVCTSSNARQLFQWAFRVGTHILFLPDEHLGRNTALDMGLPESAVGLWDPTDPAPPAAFATARVVVWRGYCSVHVRMTPEDVRRARDESPGALVVVHPECTRSVVERADAAGSTTGIIRFVERAPASSTIYVGTEINLVSRLGHEHADRTVRPLCPSRCVTMSMTTSRDLLWVLEGILEGAPRNVVTVDEETRRWSSTALERMLAAR